MTQKEKIEIDIVKLLRNHTADGHTDGYKEISSYVIKLLDKAIKDKLEAMDEEISDLLVTYTGQNIKH